MSAHTPRPWINSMHRTVNAVIGGREVALCEIFSGAVDSLDEADANQALIASAPTLLEALTLAASKPLAEHCTDEEWAFIRSAIMGAQGEQP